MADANTPSTSDNHPISTAVDQAKDAAASAVVTAKEGVDQLNDATSAHPIRDQFAATAQTIRDEAGKHASNLKGEASALKYQASTKAREAAVMGKDKAAGAVGSIAKLLEDTAATVDEKFGKQYGDYARSAADSVSGFASTLESKDLDELATSARDFVKKSPGVAVGAAAVAGFVIARLLSGSSKE